VFEKLITNWSEFSATIIVVYAVIYGLFKLANDVVDFLKKTADLRSLKASVQNREGRIYLPTKKEVRHYSIKQFILLPFLISVPAAVWVVGEPDQMNVNRGVDSELQEYSYNYFSEFLPAGNQKIVTDIYWKLSSLNSVDYSVEKFEKIANRVKITEARIAAEIEYLRNLDVFLADEFDRSVARKKYLANEMF